MYTTSSQFQTLAKCSRRLICIFAWVIAFTCQTVWAIGPYTYNAAGDEITDTATGLIWQRCSAGQTWAGGTCSGTATAMMHEIALTYAAGQAGWRLPNVKELASIVDGSRINPSIDIVTFPNTISTAYWTTTPYAANTSGAWYVNFINGAMYFGGRTSTNGLYVRLVR